MCNYRLESYIIDLAAWHNAQPRGFELPPLFRFTQPRLACSPCRSQPPTLPCVRSRRDALPDQGRRTGHGHTAPLAPSALHSHHIWHLCVRGATLSGGQHSDHHPVQPTSPLSSKDPREKYALRQHLSHRRSPWNCTRGQPELGQAGTCWKLEIWVNLHWTVKCQIMFPRKLFFFPIKRMQM